MNKISKAEEEKQSWACPDNCVSMEQINNIPQKENYNIVYHDDIYKDLDGHPLYFLFNSGIIF